MTAETATAGESARSLCAALRCEGHFFASRQELSLRAASGRPASPTRFLPLCCRFPPNLQWIFLRLFEKGLAYQAEVPVNWCPALGTVLANEEVIDGKSERGSHPVIRKPMKQWMLRITAFADRLVEDLDSLDWPEGIKDMQRNWVGRSEGAQLRFAVLAGGEAGEPSGEAIEVFTTRPDTLFGASYMVLAPEHPLVGKLAAGGQEAAVSAYVQAASRKSDLERTDLAKEKSGVFTGSFARNPATGKAIPIWVADYVLGGYGSGAIMAVPAHDKRDLDFAKQFGLPVTTVVAGGAEGDAFAGEGLMVNSSSAELDVNGARRRSLGTHPRLRADSSALLESEQALCEKQSTRPAAPALSCRAEEHGGGGEGGGLAEEQGPRGQEGARAPARVQQEVVLCSVCPV